MSVRASIIISLGFVIGLSLLASLVGSTALKYRDKERTVVVKGLAEHEYPADVVIWPISYQAAGNEMDRLYLDLETNHRKVRRFLEESGIQESDITINVPVVLDKYADNYGNTNEIAFRFSASQTVTVYSTEIDLIREAMSLLSSLGRDGVPLTNNGYDNQTQYIFSKLNSVKPEMIEEAIINARLVAEKFALHSNSTLGKIRSANQGQFSIDDRDSNNPHIKKIRIVATIEYYLAD